MIVFDTSVIVPLIRKDDPRHRWAARARKRHSHEMVVAPLWRSECRNALNKYIRAGELSQDDARRAFHTAEQLVSGLEREPDTVRVFSLAAEYGLSTYDAEHLALAVDGGGTVLTDDTRSFAKRVPEYCLSLGTYAA